ncbi:MAG: DUF2169 domain-containing protein [Desulfovibrionaceae bacterium]|nr:DUF2169 domain-containing protein [Desulfovibrionaceae bacterium]
MPYVTNITPFQGQAIEHRFYNGHPYDCLFVKATFRLTHDGLLKPLIDQPAFVISDVHEGNEGRSALLYPSDLIPFKPGTDLIVTGSAKPAGGKPASRWLAAIAVYRDGQDAPALKKIVQLTGPRHWTCGLLAGWPLSDIEPASAVALSYALAYGGASAGPWSQPRDIYWPNPFGRGYLGRDKPDMARAYPAPQILAPDVDAPKWLKPQKTVGLSPVDGLQQARLEFAGTYDRRWEQEVKPNIPLDMKLDFWNTVPQDQVAHPYLNGGEEIRTIGLFASEDGVCNFKLPRYQVFAVPLRGERKLDRLDMNLDTVVIDLDKRHVTLRWATRADQDEGYDEYELVAFEPKAATAPTAAAQPRKARP